MRKFGLLLIVIAMFAGVTVSAQKKSKSALIAPPTPELITVQDERGEGFMVLDLATGAYKCTLCEYDYSFSGVGSVKLDGCLAIFGGNGEGYNMTAYVDLCERTAKCIVQVYSVKGLDIEPYEEVLSDSNIRDSKATCDKPIPPPVESPTEIILQNDADGSFLLFVTATGEYKFIHCEDKSAMGGIGKVTTLGSWVNFEVIDKGYRILASVDLNTKAGKAVVDVFVPIGEMPPMQEVISDQNFTDNVPACGAKN